MTSQRLSRLPLVTATGWSTALALQTILSHLDTSSILLLFGGIHPLLSRMLIAEMQHRLLVFLNDLIDSPADLIAVMATTEAVFSGSAAFAFITGMQVDQPYTMVQRGFLNLGERTIRNHPNYCIASPMHPHPGLSRMITMMSACSTKHLIIEVTGTDNPTYPSSPSVPIAFASSTLFFNYVAANGFLSSNFITSTIHTTLTPKVTPSSSLGMRSKVCGSEPIRGSGTVCPAHLARPDRAHPRGCPPALCGISEIADV
ncbi:hypothetical protein C8Q76DRAFT_692725 [Earliella scabrosa]|nr:hypothetical protein C8Q76DRAFT_692725 [Earliella scabrosa]